MAKRENISMSVIRRLPRYYRYLVILKSKGVTRISSTELSKRLGLTASQIRQDLNCFGGFGQQGYGYIVDQLCIEIGNILGLSSGYRCILVGAGNLGRAIATHLSFASEGFKLSAIFDSDERKVGTVINQVAIRNTSEMETFCEQQKPTMAILCVPREAAGELSERLYKLGVRNFWNFSHYDIAMKFPDAKVENVHLNDSLMTLCYRITNDNESDKNE